MGCMPKTAKSQPRGLAGPNAYLIGFMGTGKSAVGRGLAHRLGMRFMDSDRQIERQAGKTVSEIFKTDGEGAFRKLESEFIETGHPGRGCIVACGGGLAVQEGMLERLNEKGIVIALFASPEAIVDRTSRNNRRPLLNVEDPEGAVRELMEERMHIYEQARNVISTDNRPLNDVIGLAIRFYHADVQRHTPPVQGDTLQLSK